MKLFLIKQSQNTGYDTYDSAVVSAPDEETAKHMDPGSGKPVEKWNSNYLSWCNGPEHVTVRYLGEAVDMEQGVVCASFNAG
jgi:hypothetical protein